MVEVEEVAPRLLRGDRASGENAYYFAHGRKFEIPEEGPQP